jgi:methylenetetrahydrofolate reductase (NADPH)
MSKIASILENGPTYSYEFFPPKDIAQATVLTATIGELAVTQPDFISVTYGALGNTRETTKNTVIEQNGRWAFPTMAHLTCVGQRREEIVGLIDEYASSGLENILALRGDGDEPGDFPHAIHLAEFIKDRYPAMSVGVAAHPEIHPDSSSRKQDRATLAAKLEVADFAITQFFFDADHYHRLVDELDALGSNKPIVPGVMLFTTSAGLIRMADMNNTSLPTALIAELDTLDKPADVSKLAIETAADLISDLSDYDIPGVHIYTLNKSGPALALTELLK